MDQKENAAPLMGPPAFNPEEELKRIRKKYDDLCRQMDEILMETMERSNRIVMETEISNLIMSQVFNASNDGIWAVDKNFRVIRINKRMLEWLGLPAKDVVGSKCYELTDFCHNREKCPIEKISKGVRMVKQEETISFKSGKTVPFNVTSTPLSDLDQCVIGIVENFADITERKNYEKELQRLATEDGLTCLYNRRHFDDYLNREWRRQARNRNQISLIMCDVDFFKSYNDHYGHQAGDVCLQMVADEMRSHALRPGDLKARYGGEEFAVVMPETDLKGARHVAELIRRGIAEKRITHSYSSAAPHVTISCGVAAMYPSSSNRPQELIEEADRALYRAKNNGRNCVMTFEDKDAKAVYVS